MTDKVNPSINRPAEAFKTAGAIALAGGADPGYITEAANPSELSVQDSSITEANLNAFAQTSGGASLDVTIDPGEAFVYGSWLAIDTATTVTLAASTNDQTVYVGWNKDGSDDVIVGLQAAFDNASGNTDQKIPLFDFDTDATGVTDSTDRRKIGPDTIKTQFNKSSIPLSSIPDGDNASVRAFIPSDENIKIWQVGVQNGNQSTQAGLSIQAYDLTQAQTIYSTGQKIAQGYPLAENGGGIDVSFRVVNGTGASVNASGYVVWTSD